MSRRRCAAPDCGRCVPDDRVFCNEHNRQLVGGTGHAAHQQPSHEPLGGTGHQPVQPRGPDPAPPPAASGGDGSDDGTSTSGPVDKPGGGAGGAGRSPGEVAWSGSRKRRRRLGELASQLNQIAALGACAGLDLAWFFPERGEPTGPAKAVCRGCPVREACLEYALAAGETFGIWGGMSERERRRLRRQRRQPGPGKGRKEVAA